MFFSSYFEFFLIFIFIVGFNLVKRISVNESLMGLLLFAGNLLIISTLVNFHTILVLSIVAVLAYQTGKWISDQRRAYRTRSNLLYLILFVLIFLFCLRNYEWFQRFFIQFQIADLVDSVSLVGRIGLSYILFRLLHYLVDSFKGKITEYDALSFYNYIFFFPTFLSGPIDRYNNFHFWHYKRRDKYTEVMMLQGTSRIFIGAVKKLIVVPLIIDYTNDITLFSAVTTDWFWQLCLSLLVYSFYIYFDFSGYSDIAIGTAYLIGIKTPENFKNPYVSGNISTFWKKWHISFSSILGEYIFKPFVVQLSKLFPVIPRLMISIVGYLFTFVICGLWHGSTLNYVYWGLWHAIGLSIYKSWDFTNVGKRIQKVRALNSLYNYGSVLITFVFVTVGWFFFKTDHATIKKVAQNKIEWINDEYQVDNSIELKANNHYWQGYGWGIMLRYEVEDDDQVDVEYKMIDAEAWSRAVSSLAGKSGHYDIHGGITNKNDHRNLEPGMYLVRMRVNKEEWYGNIVVIPNYQKE